MKIRELIAELSKFDGDLEVVVVEFDGEYGAWVYPDEPVLTRATISGTKGDPHVGIEEDANGTTVVIRSWASV